MFVRVLAAVCLGALTATAVAAARPQTTAPNLFVKVHVVITDKKITVSPKRAPRGSDAQFIVRNVGKRTHTFTLGTTKRGLGFQTGFSRIVKPGQRRVLLLFLDYRGPLPYYSNTPRDRKKAAMHGTFVVGNDVTGSVN